MEEKKEITAEAARNVAVENVGFTKFWMVFVKGTPGPTMVHYNKDIALREMERLARKSHRKTYLIAAVDAMELADKTLIEQTTNDIKVRSGRMTYEEYMEKKRVHLENKRISDELARTAQERKEKKARELQERKERKSEPVYAKCGEEPEHKVVMRVRARRNISN